MAGEFEKIINFIIPIAVWIFLGWIIYRIPVVRDGIDRLKEWNENRKNKNAQPERSIYKSVNYE